MFTFVRFFLEMCLVTLFITFATPLFKVPFFNFKVKPKVSTKPKTILHGLLKMKKKGQQCFSDEIFTVNKDTRVIILKIGAL